MATTTNYGWDTPDDTDLVKDGALAMRDLGQDVDTSLFSITNGKNVGLVPLVESSFTATAGVTVDNVFSATYQNYKVHLNITAASANADLNWTFRTSAPADLASNYQSGAFLTYSGGTLNATFGGNKYLGFTLLASGQQHAYDLTVSNPVSSFKWVTGFNGGATTAAGGQIGLTSCFIRNDTATNAAGFKIVPNTGTITGTIRVYGIRNS
jgi:hypothetical protein